MSVNTVQNINNFPGKNPNRRNIKMQQSSVFHRSHFSVQFLWCECLNSEQFSQVVKFCQLDPLSVKCQVKESWVFVVLVSLSSSGLSVIVISQRQNEVVTNPTTPVNLLRKKDLRSSLSDERSNHISRWLAIPLVREKIQFQVSESKEVPRGVKKNLACIQYEALIVFSHKSLITYGHLHSQKTVTTIFMTQFCGSNSFNPHNFNVR